MNNAKGSIVIEVRDAETMRLKNTITEDNVLTFGLMQADIWGPTTATEWHNAGAFTMGTITVSTRQITSGNQSWGNYAPGFNWPGGAIFPSNHEVKNEDSELSNWIFTDGVPPYIEKSGRFNSPASIRTINSVFLTQHGAGQTFPSSAISLNTPCIQNPGEVLDITYRVQFIEQPVTPQPGTYVSDEHYRNGYIATRFRGSMRYNSFPSQAWAMFSKVPENTPDNDLRRISTPYVDRGIQDARLYGTGTSSERDVYSLHFKTTFTNVLEKDDLVGLIIRGVALGSQNDSFGSGGEEGPNLRSFGSCEVMSPIVGDDFAFKPIQPIQNHNKDAIEWGLDVDYLASSQGSITVNGDNWDNPDWPEFWRVEFTSTGETGTANYFYRNRRLVGFDDITYQPALVHAHGDVAQTFQQYANVPEISPVTRSTVGSPHGLGEAIRTEEYNADSYVSWDKTGIHIHLVNDTKVITYDVNSTPSLPATVITQVAVAESGEVWIGCRGTGLYRITTPLNKTTATITKMTVGTNGLHTASDGNCYGVAIGQNDTVWAVFDGALSQTTTPTAGTPTFDNYHPLSTTPFDFAAITADWSLVKYLKADRQSQDDHLALIYEHTTNEETVIWWSTAGVAIVGPDTNNLYNATFEFSINDEVINRADVSRRGGLWVRKGPNLLDNVQRMIWGSASTSDITEQASVPAMSRIGFVYDYYDVPYVLAHTRAYIDGSGRFGITITSVDRRTASPHPGPWTGSSGYQLACVGVCFQDKRASGMYKIHGSDYSEYGHRNGNTDAHWYQPAPYQTGTIMDALNGQHSPFEELMWDKYNWNGSAWELNYFTDALDTSGGTTYNAPRHNFDTESHFFTGRSLIDITATFDANNFTSTATATFAASLQPFDKHYGKDGHPYREARQSIGSTIFDFSTPTRQCKLMWQSDDYLNADIIFVENDTVTTLVTTPAISAAWQRIVCVISGTSVDVYLDGAQIGSTITVSSAFDWTNTTNDMTAYVGSRVNRWDNQQGSPWPEDFYRGYMENVQLWNVAWDATDISNDFANITGVIVSKPGANLLTRLELTQSLAGTETKTTHAAAEPMTQGLTIAFNNGTNTPSFVATDYYTFGVVDGILKDNSLSFTREHSLYAKPVDYSFSDFKNENGTSVIEGNSTTQITEPAYFKSFAPVSSPTSTASTLGDIDVYPGKYTSAGTSGNITDYYYHAYVENAYTHQRITGDGYFELKPAAGDIYTAFGLSIDSAWVDNSTSDNAARIAFAIDILPNGSLQIRESGAVVATAVGNYTVDTTLRVRKTGTVITYHTEVGGSESLIYTSATAASAPFYFGLVIHSRPGNSVIEAKMNYTRLSNMLTVGDPIALTGKFDDKFIRLDALDQTSAAIEIDGTPATIHMMDSETVDNFPTPAPFEVVIDSRSGWMIFNPADIGKTVTGRVTVIYDEL